MGGPYAEYWSSSSSNSREPGLPVVHILEFKGPIGFWLWLGLVWLCFSNLKDLLASVWVRIGFGWVCFLGQVVDSGLPVGFDLPFSAIFLGSAAGPCHPLPALPLLPFLSNTDIDQTPSPRYYVGARRLTTFVNRTEEPAISRTTDNDKVTYRTCQEPSLPVRQQANRSRRRSQRFVQVGRSRKTEPENGDLGRRVRVTLAVKGRDAGKMPVVDLTLPARGPRGFVRKGHRPKNALWPALASGCLTASAGVLSLKRNS